MKTKYFFLIPFLIILFSINAYSQKKFIWGVASASYQVEGAYKDDGKGLSNWDVYTNKYKVTQAFTDTNQTANISVNQYNRKQYLQDFALMKKLGVTHYRFSIAWSRILPNGTGRINKKGIQHYHQFIDDLKSFGIEPCVTLYHWDMPQALQEKGGWSNVDMIKAYENYSNLIFKEYGKKVKLFITFNEPYIDLFLFTTTANNIIHKKADPFNTTSQEIADQALAAHHLIIANATTINNYHKLHLGGEIGITLSLSPSIAKDSSNANDLLAATLQDGFHNRWFLDAALKATYPKDIVAAYKKYNVNISDEEIPKLSFSKPDFIGVNFYAPNYISWDEHFPMNVNWMTNNPDSVKMFNGPVRPEYLYKLLMRIKNEYNDPQIIITENGAGFGDADDQLINGVVKDNMRCKYIQDHIDAASRAKKDGAKLTGYFLWSILDNFEWLWGYDKRFGIVYTNFTTQKRIPKNSYYLYKKIIAQKKKQYE